MPRHRATILLLTLALLATSLTGCLGLAQERLGLTSAAPQEGRLVVAVQPVPTDELANLTLVFSKVTPVATVEDALNATPPEAPADDGGDGHQHDDGHDHAHGHRGLAHGPLERLGALSDHEGETHSGGSGDATPIGTVREAAVAGDGAPTVLLDATVAPGAVAGFVIDVASAQGRNASGDVPVRLERRAFAIPHNVTVTAGQTTAVTFTMDLVRGLRAAGDGYALTPRPGALVVAVDGAIVEEVDLGTKLARLEAQRLKGEALPAPAITVTNATGAETTTAFAGDALTLTAAYPEGSSAGERVVNYIWSLGDGNVREGREVTHAYNTPGLHTATLTVEDSLGREATATVTLDVAMRKTFEGAVFAGTDGQDAVEGRDHHDHEFQPPEGAKRLRLILAYDPTTDEPAQDQAVMDNNLILTVYDGEGNEVAKATGADNPKVLELDAADVGGAATLRVSGAQGVGVGYALTAEVFFR